ncbi:hypothetical protein JXB12_06155 [candidate division KSB1 bacterium]|nr:hypothetical protein [candidate division KSB1 bacterium]
MNKLAVLTCIILLPVISFASSSQIQTYNSFTKLEQGTSDGVSLSSEGELRLSPRIETVFESQETFIWDIVSAADGTIYFSAGNQGLIYRILKSGDIDTLCKLDEIQIHALVTDRHNNVYAASSPNGKVYKIDRNGNISVVFDPPDTYIWDLTFDKSNNLFVATGDSGAIYQITANGKSSLFYMSTESHIRALNWDNSGNLIAGSMGNGYVYRISPAGKAYIIYDSDLREIHQIEVTSDGTIYAAGLGRTTPVSPVGPTPPKEEEKKEANKENENNEIPGVYVLDEIEIEAPSLTAGLRVSAESGIFKIDPNGMIRNIWDEAREPVQSIALKSGGTLIVGTGKNGKLFSYDSSNKKVLITGFQQAQISSLYFDKTDQTILMATANLGTVYRMTEKTRSVGQYQSEVFDSYSISNWGSISWEYDCPDGCDIKFYSRTGNTKEPNNTWSDWSVSYHNSEGSKITNPNARFFQWKAELSSRKNDSSPIIKKVNISYVQENVEPIIHQITIHPQGEFYQHPQQNFEYEGPSYGEDVMESKNNSSANDRSSDYMGRKLARKGYRTVSWQATDDNNDKLLYDIYLKLTSTENWKLLVSHWPVSFISWDTYRFPDGVYQIKLVTTDSLANPIDQAKTTERISNTFEIDNSGPQISEIELQTKDNLINVKFKVTDRFNPIQDLLYSIDGNKWKRVFPTDKIFDTRNEYFEIQDSFIKDGSTHSLMFKAIDLVFNLGFAHRYFEE